MTKQLGQLLPIGNLTHIAGSDGTNAETLTLGLAPREDFIIALYVRMLDEGLIELPPPIFEVDFSTFANTTELLAVWTDESTGTSSVAIDSGRLALTRVAGDGYPQVDLGVSGFTIGNPYRLTVLGADNDPQTLLYNPNDLGYGTDVVRNFVATGTSFTLGVGGKSTASTETSYVEGIKIERLIIP